MKSKKLRYAKVTIVAVGRARQYPAKKTPYIHVPQTEDSVMRALGKLYTFEPHSEVKSGAVIFSGNLKEGIDIAKAFNKIKAIKSEEKIIFKGWPGEVVFHFNAKDYFYAMAVQKNTITVRRAFRTKKV